MLLSMVSLLRILTIVAAAASAYADSPPSPAPADLNSPPPIPTADPEGTAPTGTTEGKWGFRPRPRPWLPWFRDSPPPPWWNGANRLDEKKNSDSVPRATCDQLIKDGSIKGCFAYEVREHDTFRNLVRKVGVSAKIMKKINPQLREAHYKVKPGQTINVPIDLEFADAPGEDFLWAPNGGPEEAEAPIAPLDGDIPDAPPPPEEPLDHMKKEGPSTPRDRDGDVPIPKPVMFGRVEALPTPSLGSESPQEAELAAPPGFITADRPTFEALIEPPGAPSPHSKGKSPKEPKGSSSLGSDDGEYVPGRSASLASADSPPPPSVSEGPEGTEGLAIPPGFITADRPTLDTLVEPPGTPPLSLLPRTANTTPPSASLPLDEGLPGSEAGGPSSTEKPGKVEGAPSRHRKELGNAAETPDSEPSPDFEPSPDAMP